MKQLITSIHDVHPKTFEAAREQIAFCESLGVSRFSILLVPTFHKREPFEFHEDLVSWLRARENLGDEIVLHGLFHLNDAPLRVSVRDWFWQRFYTTNEAEFLDLDLQSARTRIQAGRDRLRKAGLCPAGFIAPAWLQNPSVVRAALELGFTYTNTARWILPASGRAIRSRSLCYSGRAAWRKPMSLVWNSMLWAVKRSDDVVRLGIHPRDLEVPAFRNQISAILLEAIGLEFKATTYRDLVAAHIKQLV